MLAGLENHVIAFVLVLTRVTGLLLTTPFLAIEIAPARSRIALAVALAFVLTMATVSSAPGVDSAGALALAMVGELALGALCGMVVRVALAAAEIAGEIAGMQMGFGFARTVNPLTAQQTGALTRLVSVAAGILFFAIGAHRQVIQAVADSLHAVPAGAAVNDQAWSELLVDSVSGMFVAGLRIALPLVVTVLASHLTFGLLSRIAPQLNLWSVGFLVSISVGLVGLTVFAPALVAEIRATLSHGIATALGAARM